MAVFSNAKGAPHHIRGATALDSRVVAAANEKMGAVESKKSDGCESRTGRVLASNKQESLLGRWERRGEHTRMEGPRCAYQ